MFADGSTVEASSGVASSARVAFRDGTERITSPEETLARVGPVLGTMGITRVANLTGLDRVGIPTVAVCRPNARSIAVSQGKGATLNAAKASGIMESIEAFHAEHIELPLVFASYAELVRGRDVIDVAGLAQTRLTDFSVHQPLLWVEGQELVSGRKLLTPFVTVSTDFRLPFPAGARAFLQSSNGLASGNHAFEALSHGLCELIERDANTLHRYRSPESQALARLSLPSIDDPLCRALLERFEAAAIDVAVWETTSEVGIVSYLCHVADRFPTPERPFAPAYGSGCHLRREIALSRALTEAAQCRLTMISGSRDDVGSQAYAAAETRERLARFNARFSGPSSRSFDQAPSYEASHLDDSVNQEVTQLFRAGFKQVLGVDLSKPEFGIPVVRTIVPGLEGVSEAPSYRLGQRARALQARSS